MPGIERRLVFALTLFVISSFRRRIGSLCRSASFRCAFRSAISASWRAIRLAGRLQFTGLLVARTLRVRENTVISDAEQDHLPFARPWNDLFASQRVARREANPKEPCCPRPGRNLDKKKRFSENPLIPFSGQLARHRFQVGERLPR